MVVVLVSVCLVFLVLSCFWYFVLIVLILSMMLDGSLRVFSCLSGLLVFFSVLCLRDEWILVRRECVLVICVLVRVVLMFCWILLNSGCGLCFVIVVCSCSLVWWRFEFVIVWSFLILVVILCLCFLWLMWFFR